jgi:hypothetical protein
MPFVWAIAVALAAQTQSTPAPVALPAGAPAPGLLIQVAPPQATPDQAWPDDRPITRFFQNLGRDLKALPSVRTGGLLVAGVGGTLLAHARDDQVDGWVKKQGGGGGGGGGRPPRLA